MEPTMTFQPGTYYVGDPGFVLPNDDLRMLFAQSMHGGLKSGPRELVTSRRFEDGQMVCDFYWLAATPHKQGTIYDQDNKGWGFDWGCFGVVPWKWIDCQGSYESNKIEFTEPFECSFTEDSITIGHLHFTFSPK
jgi:hypothetical protein